MMMKEEEKKPMPPAAPTTVQLAPVNYTKEVVTAAKAMVDETYNSSLASINTGFALAAALAWNDSVKVIIQKFIKNNTSVAQMHLVYAVVVTLLSALVFTLTKKFLKPSLKKSQVSPVLLR